MAQQLLNSFQMADRLNALSSDGMKRTEAKELEAAFKQFGLLPPSIRARVGCIAALRALAARGRVRPDLFEEATRIAFVKVYRSETSGRTMLADTLTPEFLRLQQEFMQAFDAQRYPPLGLSFVALVCERLSGGRAPSSLIPVVGTFMKAELETSMELFESYGMEDALDPLVLESRPPATEADLASLLYLQIHRVLFHSAEAKELRSCIYDEGIGETSEAFDFTLLALVSASFWIAGCRPVLHGMDFTRRVISEALQRWINDHLYCGVEPKSAEEQFNPLMQEFAASYLSLLDDAASLKNLSALAAPKLLRWVESEELEGLVARFVKRLVETAFAVFRNAAGVTPAAAV